MPEIQPFIWFARDAQSAARRYTELFPNSRIVDVWRTPAADGTPGATELVRFELDGQPFTALGGGGNEPGFEPSRRISLFATCEDQAEVDTLWDGLMEGGTALACGWLTDRFGVTWQIVPRRLMEMLAAEDRDAAGRAYAAMMAMVKIDVAALEAAFAG